MFQTGLDGFIQPPVGPLFSYSVYRTKILRTKQKLEKENMIKAE